MSIGYRALRAVLFRLEAERAHALGLAALRLGLVPGRRVPGDDRLAMRQWGLDFPNPVGMAAGFDKNAEAIRGLFGLGFGFVEVGTVTPRPQAGNPRPRLFRLPEDGAIINRLGFNNDGARQVAARLSSWRRRGRPGIVGVNVGAGRASADRIADYVSGITTFAPLADYLVINVSSPNTPGLRDLQGRAALDRLIARAKEARDKAMEGECRPPLLIKIAPDLDAAARRDIVAVALDRGIDGIIVSNTTVARPEGLRGRHRGEAGGLSGRPLFEPATRLLADIYRLGDGRIPLIGTGGIFSGADAYAKIRAGASLVQIYTALIYEGPGVVARITGELIRCLEADGFGDLAQAVGSGCDAWPTPA